MPKSKTYTPPIRPYYGFVLNTVMWLVSVGGVLFSLLVLMQNPPSGVLLLAASVLANPNIAVRFRRFFRYELLIVGALCVALSALAALFEAPDPPHERVFQSNQVERGEVLSDRFTLLI